MQPNVPLNEDKSREESADQARASSLNIRGLPGVQGNGKCSILSNSVQFFRKPVSIGDLPRTKGAERGRFELG